MKHIKDTSIVCLFVVLLEVSVFSEYNWNKIPFPSGPSSIDTLFSIHAFNENEAIAAGSNGAIVYVNYSESIYSTVKYGDNSFRWICFSDSLNGWIVGDNGTIYSTNDRGITWVQQLIDTKSNLNSVASVDKDNVWVVGDSGIILHSSDGGTSWERQTIEIVSVKNSMSDYFNLIAVAFKNESVGIACGKWNETLRRVVLLTCDAGLHWKEIGCTDLINVFDVAFNGEMVVVYVEGSPYGNFVFPVDNEDLSCFQEVQFENVCNSNGYYSNSCGSAHKVNKFTIISNQKIYAIDSVDSKTSWIAGTNGSIYRTTDSCKNWIYVAGDKNCAIDHLTKIYFRDGQHGFIGGDNGLLLLSDDSGKTWQFTDIPVNSSISIRDIIFCDSLCGVLSACSKTGHNMSPWYTIDGGRTWQLIKEGSQQYLIRNVHQTGIIGLSSTGMHYFCKEGKNNWLNQQINTRLSFYDIFPITPDTLFLVGSSENIWEGAIFKSTDFGKSFDLVSSVDRLDSKNTYFYSITFSDQSTGWVVGENGIILKSIDSGYTWKRQPSPTAYDLTKIRFCNSDFGWMFGQNRIFLTFDGGDTWQDKSILTSAKVNDVFCSDPQNCWAVGDDGLILHLSNKLEKFIDITFPGKNEAFVVGDSVTVKWESCGISQVSIAISYDGGKNYTVYRNATDNDGEETVRISANAIASDSCRVRISSVEGTVADESEYFKITKSSATVNPGISLNKFGCYFKGSSVHYYLTEDASIEISIFTISGREVYRNRILLKGKGPVVQKFTSGTLKRGCYLAQVNIGGKYFKGKLIIHR